MQEQEEWKDRINQGRGEKVKGKRKGMRSRGKGKERRKNGQGKEVVSGRREKERDRERD